MNRFETDPPIDHVRAASRVAASAPPLEYQMRRSKRAKRVTLRVSPGRGLVVTAPLHASEAQIEAAVDARSDWARRALEDSERALPDACREWPPRRLELVAIGQRIVLGFVPPGSPVPVLGDTVGSVLSIAADPADRTAVAETVAAWLKPVARQHLVARLEVLARRHGAVYRRCSVRGQRSVWGSYSSTGTLSLNYKLLFLSRELVDYVLLHELAHTCHADHSPRFWALLERWMPGARELDGTLRGATRYVPPWLELSR